MSINQPKSPEQPRYKFLFRENSDYAADRKRSQVTRQFIINIAEDNDVQLRPEDIVIETTDEFDPSILFDFTHVILHDLDYQALLNLDIFLDQHPELRSCIILLTTNARDQYGSTESEITAIYNTLEKKGLTTMARYDSLDIWSTKIGEIFRNSLNKKPQEKPSHPHSPEQPRVISILIRENSSYMADIHAEGILNTPEAELLNLDWSNVVYQVCKNSEPLLPIHFRDLERSTAAIIHDYTLQDLYIIEAYLKSNPSAAPKFVVLINNTARKQKDFLEVITRIGNLGARTEPKELFVLNYQRAARILLGIKIEDSEVEP